MRGGPSESVPLFGAVGGLIGVACCAGLPLLATVLGGLTLAAVLGVAGGVLLAAVALGVVLLLLRDRRRRDCEPTKKATR